MKIKPTHYLPDLIGKGYASFWKTRKRYRVVKGSRGSKKSKTCGIYYPYMMMQHPEANLLVVRRNFRTLKDSCYSDLMWGIERLGVSHLWKGTLSPLEITYKPTGQKILFRGLDDGLKITSISVPKGKLCWVWVNNSAHTLINLSNCWDVLIAEEVGKISSEATDNIKWAWHNMLMIFIRRLCHGRNLERCCWL